MAVAPAPQEGVWRVESRRESVHTGIIYTLDYYYYLVLVTSTCTYYYFLLLLLILLLLLLLLLLLDFTLFFQHH